jgi:hypothetical protein
VPGIVMMTAVGSQQLDVQCDLVREAPDTRRTRLATVPATLSTAPETATLEPSVSDTARGNRLVCEAWMSQQAIPCDIHEGGRSAVHEGGRSAAALL